MVLFLLSLLAAADDGREVRGMTVSCPTWGWEWGSDAMVTTLDELAALGANWVAIHPYAQIGGDGSVGYRALDPTSPPDWLARPIAEAHRRGLRVMIKPHLAYWGSPYRWRGEIRFDDPKARARFFREYQAWIVQVAGASVGADAFVIGTELDGTIEHETEWREVIGAVRAVHAGHLTYASNWTDYGRVPFWDALDAVGVQGYFPLVASDAPPDAAALQAGWAEVMGGLRSIHERTGKPVILTELGYPRAASAARQPWLPADSPEHADLQESCLRVALDAIAAEPAVVGAFLWKWFPGDAQPRDFSMESDGVQAVLRETWRR